MGSMRYSAATVAAYQRRPAIQNRNFFALIFLIVLSLAAASINARARATASGPNTQLFDWDWRFHRGGAQGAEAPDFDDSKWGKLDLPHDWSIEDLPGTNSPFTP